MRILVDGDSCPVIDLTVEIANKYMIVLKVFADIYHNIKIDFGELILVDKGNQSVDMCIVNQCQSGDIVVTADYGLAALALGKNSQVIDFSGRIYSEKNINFLLMKRHKHAKIRRTGGSHSTQSKRTQEDDIKYQKSLIVLIESNL
ncbi:MAG: hypothetical protein FH762_12050 [Firmicutes bacterium]|nr:hypothetical protein [Bacillota bacterium]